VARARHRVLTAAGLLVWAATAGANGAAVAAGDTGSGASGANTAAGSGGAGTTASSGAATGSAGGGGSAAKPGAAGGGAGQGKELFNSGTTPSCAVCHVLRDAGATGNIGPNLDELRPDAARVAHAVKNGFENMPAFGNVLSETQIQALSRYVEQAAAGK
jgi:cytochrome c6